MPGVATIPIAIMALPMLGPSAAVIASARIRPGKACTASTTRMTTSSTQPPV